jgi:hypothetical protein
MSFAPEHRSCFDTNVVRRPTLFLAVLVCVAIAESTLGFASIGATTREFSGDDGSAVILPRPSTIEAAARAMLVQITIAAAPVAKRLPAIPPFARTMLAHSSELNTTFRFEPSCTGADCVHVRVRRHVPRMKSGDPPRA